MAAFAGLCTEAKVVCIAALGARQGISRQDLLAQCRQYVGDAAEALLQARRQNIIITADNGLLTVEDAAATALTALQTLSLCWCSDLTQLPPELGQLTALQTLDLEYCNSLTQLPPELGQLTALQMLDLRECSSLTQLPQELGQLTALQTLDLSGCSSLTQLPPQLGQLTALQTLQLGGCKQLTQLPPELRQLTALQMLWLGGCIGLTQLPPQLGQLTALQMLDLSRCIGLTQLPPELGKLTALQTLNLKHCSGLTQLPPWLGQLTALQTLDLNWCTSLTQLPPELGQLTALQTLWLWDCRSLTQLSPELGQLPALQTLDLSWCSGLTQLPPELGQLTALQTLDLSWCSGLAQLPPELGQLTALQKLSLGGCSGLTQLPPELGQLTALQTLDLSGCSGLTQLRPEIGQLTALWALYLLGCRELPKPLPNPDMPARHQLEHVFRLQQKDAAVTKLATQQAPMVATLERMSWLVVLFATATFIAFLQPPGSYNDNHIVLLPNTTCKAWEDPNSEQFRRCALQLFFIFDGLSFGLSVGCVVMIVIVSMPRLPFKDNKYEAGRFWLLLWSTWLLLWLAVVTGFCAFLASGLAVSTDWRMVIAPLVPGMILLLTGLVLIIWRLHSLHPGWPAVAKAICSNGYMPLDDDIEIGQQASRVFWQEAAKALREVRAPQPPVDAPEANA